MGIYIKGMEMPTSCFLCKLSFMSGERLFCSVMKNEEVLRSKIDSNCPLIELPPHGRLIDEDEISKHKYATIPPYRKEYSDGKPKSEDEVIAFKFGWNDAIDAIVANAPTIIEAEEGE